VNGIGIDKAAKLPRLESVYLSANSTYDARTFGILAATDLYGSGSAEVIATTNAFMQLELGRSGPSDTEAQPRQQQHHLEPLPHQLN
jgi:hypothetical protein